MADLSPDARMGETPVVAPGHTPGSVTDKISEIVLTKTPRWWWVAFGLSFLVMQALLVGLGYLVFEGIGIWSGGRDRQEAHLCAQGRQLTCDESGTADEHLLRDRPD
ncbi:MAG: hypothetical protein GY773_10090, partial [Actinomycetia bacterium]|nr:hypothetical protein [Actinomycetes bacterium]